MHSNARRALTIFDGAFASPAGQQPFRFGVDIVVQVVTKMLGTGNVFGTVTVAKKEIADQLESIRATPMHPEDLNRIFEYGLPTFFQRYQASLENTVQLVDWLKQQKDLVKHLSYPGDPEHPQFAITQRQAEGTNYGNMVYFDMNNLEEAKLFAQILVFLRTTKHSVSLGEASTQVQLPLAGAASTMPDDAKAKLPQMGMSLAGVRVSVGIEDPVDIIRDFQAAFDVVRRFRGRENIAPLTELREILMHPVVQSDGIQKEYVARLYPVVRNTGGSDDLTVEPKVEQRIADLQNRLKYWPASASATSTMEQNIERQKIEDILATLQIIHNATRIDLLSSRTMGVHSTIVSAVTGGYPYAVTPGAEESNAYVAQGPDQLKLGFGGPAEAGKLWSERLEMVISGLTRVYGRIGTVNSMAFERIAASAEAGTKAAFHEEFQGVSLPSLETGINVLLEAWGLQALDKDRTEPVRITVIARKGSDLERSAIKFSNIYEVLFKLKGQLRVEFSLLAPDADGNIPTLQIDTNADLVVLDELSDDDEVSIGLFQSVRQRAAKSRLAVINSSGIQRGFRPLRNGADFVLDQFTNFYKEPVSAVLVTPRDWVTRFLARRTYTSIASRAAMLGILPVTFLKIPRSSDTLTVTAPGGIDLNDQYLRMNVKTDGRGMPLPEKFQDPALIDVLGLEPIINSIVPMTPVNMPILSELLTGEQQGSV